MKSCGTRSWVSDTEGCGHFGRRLAGLDRFLLLTVNGLTRGAVFASFALALVLIWRGARLVNFAQGAMAVATAYLAFSVTLHSHSYWLGFGCAIVGGLVIGA